MNTADLFKERTVFSFEVYPAKKTAPIEVVYKAVDALSRLEPDYISVTYGAGGGAATSAATVDIANLIENTHGIPAVAHLPGINLTHAEVRSLLSRLQDLGIGNILALRGDRGGEGQLPPGAASIGSTHGDFAHASDLVRYIVETIDPQRPAWTPPFNIIGACYPEIHPEASDAATDLRHLKAKVDAGTNQLVTQLFFDNRVFYRFLDRARAAGITVPIQAGIMPIINARQAKHIIELCNPQVPAELEALIATHQDDDEAFRAAGIDFATRQIADLIERGVDGIHLYTMNNPLTAKDISKSIYPLIRTQEQQ